MESVSRFVDENAVRKANPGHRAEVIRLEPRPRLADRISLGAATLAQVPVEPETSEREPATDQRANAFVEPGPGSASSTAAADGAPLTNEDPTISADRIFTLIRQQQELIGRILQDQRAVDDPASEMAGQSLATVDPATTAVSTYPGELAACPQMHELSDLGATARHQAFIDSDVLPKQSIDNDRPPMIIERAQASQGMQLIGDLTSDGGNKRLTWPGFVAGICLSIALGALLYVKLGPPA